MKNCGPTFASKINAPFMDAMASVAKNSKNKNRNSDEALRLVQQWGRAFEKKRSQFPIFFGTFMSMKSQGFSFPEEVEAPVSDAVFEVSKPEPYTENMPAMTNRTEFQKLTDDLSTVSEKVKLCREMLQESPGVEQDEALSEVVGYLEACRDRLVDLIEAGTQGLLSEDLFATCLKVNDAVLRTLEAEKVRKAFTYGTGHVCVYVLTAGLSRRQNDVCVCNCSHTCTR